jgi:Holliday junction resolvase-like predicted endonuclease
LDIINIEKPEPKQNDIEKLAKKYHIEQDKVELALKLMSKNQSESNDDKYKVLNEMLKQNKSIEELAKQLRIPKGEIDLISSLNEL